MKKKTVLMIVAFLLGLAALAAGGVGGAWWLLRAGSDGGTQAEPETVRKLDTREYRYVTLDKVIVMLRGEDGATTLHYMAFDLVFRALGENEKLMKQQLPLLRTVAVKAMSAYTFAEATRMSIDDFEASINRAYDESYGGAENGKPFSEAMIAKLIVE